MDFKNISLIGFMGAGKTTVGKILAEKLRLVFIDLDRIIELEEERTVKDIFKIYGEDYFRELETNVIEKIYKNKNCIFACGGGAVKRKENMDIIRKNSIVVYLNISPGDAFNRLKDVKDRPLIEVGKREEVIKKMISERDTLYRKYAHIVINNSETKPEKTSEEIFTRLNS